MSNPTITDERECVCHLPRGGQVKVAHLHVRNS